MTHTTAAPGCLTRILQLFGIHPRPREEGAAPLPYHAVDALLSPAEVSLYHVLLTVVGDRAAICPKVGLGDLFFAKTGDRSRNTSYRNRIDRKHVDFLLCDPRTLAPLGAVELDDASHGRADRVARDAFVDDVFAAAGLPLVHVTAQRAYAPDALRAQLAAANPAMAGLVGGGDGAEGEAESYQPKPEPARAVSARRQRLRRRGSRAIRPPARAAARRWSCARPSAVPTPASSSGRVPTIRSAGGFCPSLPTSP